MTAWGGPAFESMTPEEQLASRTMMMDVKVEHFQEENVQLKKRIKTLEACLGRDMLDVFEENERLKREHEEMHQRLAAWQTGAR